MMKIKESIFDAVSSMNVNDLVLLYEHIRLMEKMKNISIHKKEKLSIDRILEMTGTSRSCWADSVIKERDER